METLRFAKGHGTGNDFVILPDPADTLSLTPALVAALCDRRFGIGGDGVLRVVPHAGGGWFMDYWNADGSRAEMCGNGVRVYARYLVDSGLAPAGEIPIMTRSGAVVAVVGDEISVFLPLPKVYGASTATVDGRRYDGVAVDCGNPHLVCRLPEGLSTLDLSRSPQVDPGFFPGGVNVEFFVPLSPGRVRMRVHERGVGETLSCGSGACAVAQVALGDAPGTVLVDVPGGRLTVTLDATTCRLTGPAVIVAEGEYLRRNSSTVGPSRAG